MRGASKGGTELAFGEYGIQALEPGVVGVPAK
jgi:ribosomal protein L16/L10AE